MTDRYFRCTNEACRRKWHRQSIALYETTKPMRTDLLSLPLEKKVGCPSCGGALVPEAGTFEEVIQEGRAP